MAHYTSSNHDYNTIIVNDIHFTWICDGGKFDMLNLLERFLASNPDVRLIEPVKIISEFLAFLYHNPNIDQNDLRSTILISCELEVRSFMEEAFDKRLPINLVGYSCDNMKENTCTPTNDIKKVSNVFIMPDIVGYDYTTSVLSDKKYEYTSADYYLSGAEIIGGSTPYTYANKPLDGNPKTVNGIVFDWHKSKNTEINLEELFNEFILSTRDIGSFSTHEIIFNFIIYLFQNPGITAHGVASALCSYVLGVTTSSEDTMDTKFIRLIECPFDEQALQNIDFSGHVIKGFPGDVSGFL